MTTHPGWQAGRWAAFGTALCSVLYALAIAARSAGAGASFGALLQRMALGASPAADWLLAATGFLATLAVVAVGYAARHDSPEAAEWLTWAVALGFAGAVMMAAHGVDEAVRLPVLEMHWNNGGLAQQEAIRAFSGQPNRVDPKGLGSLLFLGLYAGVVGAAVKRGSKLRSVGALHAAVATIAFVSGVLVFWLPLQPVRALATALAFGVTGPLWWLLAGRALRDG